MHKYCKNLWNNMPIVLDARSIPHKSLLYCIFLSAVIFYDRFHITKCWNSFYFRVTYYKLLKCMFIWYLEIVLRVFINVLLSFCNFLKHVSLSIQVSTWLYSVHWVHKNSQIIWSLFYNVLRRHYFMTLWEAGDFFNVISHLTFTFKERLCPPTYLKK